MVFDFMLQSSIDKMYAVKDSGTEELRIESGNSSERLEWDWVEKWHDYLKVTHKKEQEVVDTLTYWSRFWEIVAWHRHPVVNGVVNLHPSDEDGDLGAWRHQYEEYWIEHQRIIWFDPEAPYDMWRVKYTWDGKLAYHDLDGKMVQVSKIDRKWNGIWRDGDIELEDTRNLSVLEDESKEVENDDKELEREIISLKDRMNKLDQLSQAA